jgi:glycerophosphoryl diester phosphodiesterase
MLQVSTTLGPRRQVLQLALGAAALTASAFIGSAPAQAAAVYNTLSGSAPIVIGHRGASGYRPEHTLAAYDLAISQGASYIEPDLVMTKDGELIARHEPMLARVNLNADGTIKLVNGVPELNRTDTSTNVWQLSQYAGRLQVKTLDGVKVGGWWAEDFTAAEIRADIRAQERLRDVRTANNAFNDTLVLPTLQEVIDLAKARSAQLGRTIGIYPETKHPTYFKNFTDANGLQRMEDKLVAVLHANYGNSSAAPVYIQSFEVSNLQYINTKTNIRVVQLLSSGGRPYDFTVAGDTRTYADLAMATSNGLDFIDNYADGVGANTNLMISLVNGRLGTPSTLIADAHARGMEVHGWTFRAENAFLPNEFDSSADPAAFGNLRGQIQAFLALGMDGFFTDQPDLGVAAVPAPGSLSLALLGLGVGAAVRRRKAAQV